MMIHLLNRLLKVLELMISHDIIINEELENKFKQISKRKNDFVETFKLTISRIKQNEKSFEAFRHNLK